MENEMRERSGCISFWLWVSLIVNIGTIVAGMSALFDADSVKMALGLGLSSILALINILGIILLFRWDKIGFNIFVVSSFLAAALNILILEIPIIAVAGSLFAILIWWAILQIKKNGVSAWSQLQPGWDIEHCRHLYQLFAVVAVILLAFTIIASVKASDKEPEIQETNVVDDEVMDYAEVEEVVVLDSTYVDDDTLVVELETPQQPEPATKPVQPSTGGSEQPSAPRQSPMEILQNEVIAGNNEYPLDLGNGIVLTRSYISGDYVVYVYECDENTINMEMLEQNKSTLLEDIKNTIRSSSNPQLREFAKLCVNAGKGIEYLYIGDASGRKMIAFLTLSELKKLI